MKNWIEWYYAVFAEGKSWKLNKNGNPCLRYKLIMLNNAATAMCVMKYFEAIN